MAQQTQTNNSMFIDILKPHTSKTKISVAHTKNEIEFIATIALIVYKTTFSSQDSEECMFYPTCSVYSVEAIKQKGIIIGLAASFDRMSRCHPFIRPDQYRIHKPTGKYFDPVK